MSRVPKATYAFTLVLALMLASSLFATEPVPWDQLSLGGMAVLLCVALAAGYLEIPFPIPNAATFNFTVDAAIALAIGIIFGPFWGTGLVMLSTLILDLAVRRAPLKTAVNVCNLGFSTLTAAHVYLWAGGDHASPFVSRTSVTALVLASIVYTMVNTSVLAIIVSPVVGVSPLQTWLSNLPPLMVELITLPSLGGIVPVLYNENPLVPALVIVPLAAPFLAFRALRQVEQETRATIESLADALEQRDRYTHQHSIRVTGYVSAMLDQMPNIPVQSREVIQSAARVHDVGKVGISDSSLNKRGKLSPEEWREIQGHAVIGSEIVQRLSIYREESAIIRHHHERWDGRGYPDGLVGPAIPLGSRIVGVADAFDAMTSDRAYRSAMSADRALSVIRDGAGSQFDPAIVEALEHALVERKAGTQLAGIETGVDSLVVSRGAGSVSG